MQHPRRVRAESDLSAPFLPCVSYDLAAVLDQVRNERVPEPKGRIPVRFVAQAPLACIIHDESSAEIMLHQMLNTPETPLAVFLHILTHEMLHLAIQPRRIRGKEKRHPPEFFVREAALSPERLDCYTWIWTNFGSFLRSDRKREGVLIKRGWQRIMPQPRVPMDKCKEICRKQLF